MFPAPIFEREGDGRYAVSIREEGVNHRLGVVLGGNGRWIAENASGAVVRTAHTLRDAADALVEQNTFVSPRLSLSEYFERHPHRDRYREQYGNQAFARFAEMNYPRWMDTYYAAGGPEDKRIVLSEAETREIGLTAALVGVGCAPRDIVAMLAYGDRYNRWELPVVEGILSEDYWQQVLGNVGIQVEAVDLPEDPSSGRSAPGQDLTQEP